MVDGERAEEPTMIVRVLGVPRAQSLAFKFADGHLEPITALVEVTGETFLETLERVATELDARAVTETD